MKRLFNRFERETGIVSEILKKGIDKTFTDKHKSRKYPYGKFIVVDMHSQVSSAFNEWLTNLWSKQMTAGKHTYGKVSKMVIRKWCDQMAVANFGTV